MALQYERARPVDDFGRGSTTPCFILSSFTAGYGLWPFIHSEVSIGWSLGAQKWGFESGGRCILGLHVDHLHSFTVGSFKYFRCCKFRHR